jgi:hypothetical protein
MNNVHAVAPDGECLFNSIAYGILYLSTGNKHTTSQYKPLARKLRKKTVNILNTNILQMNMNAIITMSAEYNDKQNNFNLNEMVKRSKLYVKKMSKSCTWGGEIELQVLGSIVQNYGFRGVKVYDIDTKRLLMKSKMARNKNPVIHIVLHDTNSGGSHYDFWNKPQRSKFKSSSKK